MADLSSFLALCHSVFQINKTDRVLKFECYLPTPALRSHSCLAQTQRGPHSGPTEAFSHSPTKAPPQPKQLQAHNQKLRVTKCWGLSEMVVVTKAAEFRFQGLLFQGEIKGIWTAHERLPLLRHKGEWMGSRSKKQSLIPCRLHHATP